MTANSGKIVSSFATASWRGGFDGAGEVRSGGVSTRVALPAELGGRGDDTSPEDLFLAAMASCYLITLGIVLDKGKTPYEALHLDAELRTDGSGLATIKEVVLRPRIVSDADEGVLAAACLRAEAFCLISRAVGDNVKKTVAMQGSAVTPARSQTSSPAP